MNLYDVLGVNEDATAEEIKRAYRKKARESHPDNGGDGEAFRRVNEAHRVLINTEDRESYDRSGEIPNPKSAMSAAEEIMLSSLQSAVSGGAKDVFRAMRSDLDRKRSEAKAECGRVKGITKRLAKDLDQVKNQNKAPKDGSGFGLVVNWFESQIQISSEVIERMEKQIQVFGEALALVDGLQSEPDQQDRRTMAGAGYTVCTWDV